MILFWLGESIILISKIAELNVIFKERSFISFGYIQKKTKQKAKKPKLVSNGVCKERVLLTSFYGQINERTRLFCKRW